MFTLSNPIRRKSETLVLEGRGCDAPGNWEGVGGRDPWSADFSGEKFMCGGQEGGWRWFGVFLPKNISMTVAQRM